MKILFLRKRGEFGYGGPLMMHEFEQAVGKIAECKWAGPGWPLHKPGERIIQTVYRIYGKDVKDHPDWVLDCERNQKIRGPRTYKVGAYISDIHGRAAFKIYGPRAFIRYINPLKYDAVFMKTKYIHGMNCPPDIYLLKLNPKIHFLPYSIAPFKFKPLEPKKTDVVLIGSVSDKYALRQSMLEGIPPFCNERNLTYVVRSKGPRVWNSNEYEHISKFIIRRRYRELLGQTRFLLFDSSRYRYPLQKYFEAMACECVGMADEPSSADELGFVDGENYVKVDKNNWRQKLDYYLEQPEECRRIGRNGRELILERHTHYIRAREFVAMLEGAS